MIFAKLIFQEKLELKTSCKTNQCFLITTVELQKPKNSFSIKLKAFGHSATWLFNNINNNTPVVLWVDLEKEVWKEKEIFCLNFDWKKQNEMVEKILKKEEAIKSGQSFKPIKNQKTKLTNCANCQISIYEHNSFFVEDKWLCVKCDYWRMENKRINTHPAIIAGRQKDKNDYYKGKYEKEYGPCWPYE